MRALYVCSEAYPFAKTGGLADVSATLPAALRGCGIDSRILLPAYPQALERARQLREIARLSSLPGSVDARILETCLPGTAVPVWLVDCPQLYNRGGGPYQDANGADWPDNALRFAALGHAALAIADGALNGWKPQIVHANDWHAGLVPLLLRRLGSDRPRSVFTIHNLAYQGCFAADGLAHLGLAAEQFSDMEFYGRISFLKAGIAAADAITTVSPTYACEILTPAQGCGLDGLLREKAGRLSGILNGVDYRTWDPRHDSCLEANYSAQMLGPKLQSKRTILADLDLDAEEDAPLLVWLSRLTQQKMPECVLEALPELIAQGVRFALVAEGDPSYEAAFRALALQYPGRIAVRTSYQERLAHRLLAGADMLAHPAWFEPCGLVPMYAMRYGTIPVVRRTGGLADSVTDATAEALRSGTATGFVFDGVSGSEFLVAVERALDLYRQPLAWRRLQAAAMATDFGWAGPAEGYARLYHALHGRPFAAPGIAIGETRPTREEGRRRT